MEALDADALSTIFGCLPAEDRLAVLPLVCKQWAAVLAVPGPCWQTGDGLLANLAPCIPLTWFEQRKPLVKSLIIRSKPPFLRNFGPPSSAPDTLQLLRIVGPSLKHLKIGHRVLTTAECRALTSLSNLESLVVVVEYPAFVQGALSGLAGLEKLDSMHLAIDLPDGVTVGPFDTLPFVQIPEQLVPCSFGHMTSLHMAARRCRAALPADLASLCNLRTLTLESFYLQLNSLQHPPALPPVLPGIQQLTLDACGLQFVPPAVAAMTTLTNLSLRRNVLTEVASGPYLAALQALDVSCNLLLAVPPALQTAVVLQHLNLNDNPITRFREAASFLLRLQWEGSLRRVTYRRIICSPENLFKIALAEEKQAEDEQY